MIFRQIDEIVSGKKTQTRRIKKEKERYLSDLQSVVITNVYGYRAIDSLGQASYFNGHTDRLKWVVGCDYAVQPGRGKPGVCRIRITNIRQEQLQRISDMDAIAEGINWDESAFHASEGTLPTPREEYADLWDSINTRPGTRWADNPEIWVISFELVK